MNATKTTLPLLLVLALTADTPALAQELDCGAKGELPCGFEIQSVALKKVPLLFQYQARIEQAKLPVGEHTFQTVVVRVLGGTELLCAEELIGVEVFDSMLNLTIGQDMSCDLDRLLAERPNLALQVCLGGGSTCLEPVELSTVPWAIKATWAGLAQEASEAQVANQAHYAHRATADRDLLVRRMISAGYFDFRTPSAAEAVELYTALEFADLEDGGFVQWAPVRDELAMRLHLSSKDAGTDELRALDELVFGAERTLLDGDVVVTPPVGGAGLVVTAGGATVSEDSTIAGGLDVSGASATGGPVAVAGAAIVDGTLQVDGAVTVTAGGAEITGASAVGGQLHATGLMSAQSGMAITGDADLEGLVSAASMVVTGTLTASGTATFAQLSAGAAAVAGGVLAPSATLSGTTAVGGNLDVTGALTVAGPATFQGHVVFEQATDEGASGPDPAYVLAEGETRDLTFASAATFAEPVTLGADLDLTHHQLLGFRHQTAEEEPVPCAPEREGFFYLDTVKQQIMVCLDSNYAEVGGDRCGNGFVEPTEPCDDGNKEDGDGCSAACTPEAPGWACTGIETQPTICGGVCGDGWVRGLETCDDSGVAPGDGCDDTCQVEEGWDCPGEPSGCETICGDELIKGIEGCDDGNTEPGDGCDEVCAVETGWVCSGVPSECLFGVCGDELITTGAGETCDDGNTTSGDGCHGVTCTIEPNAECSGEPSVCYLHGSAFFGHIFGTAQEWVAPVNVPEATFEVCGGAGGPQKPSGYAGYGGACLTGTLALPAGSTNEFTILVGGGGQAGVAGNADGGWPGGGRGGYWGASGGGYSQVANWKMNGSYQGDIFVAGAGGGSAGVEPGYSGDYQIWNYGYGGWPNGLPSDVNVWGQGGTQSAGGLGAYPGGGADCSGLPGLKWNGGDASGCYGAGGGGGGWYGGGSGGEDYHQGNGHWNYGGGGGGSSWYNDTVVTDFSISNGTYVDPLGPYGLDGHILITW